MAAPSCRVLAGAISMNAGVIQDRLDPAAHATCRLGLGAPDRRKYRHHIVERDSVHRDVADTGGGVGVEARLPLRCRLRIAPPCLVGGDVLDGQRVEGFGGGTDCLTGGGSALFQRVATGGEVAAAIQYGLTRSGRSDQREGAEPHLTTTPPESETEQPALRVGAGDLKIQAVAHGMLARCVQPLDLQCRQPCPLSLLRFRRYVRHNPSDYPPDRAV